MVFWYFYLMTFWPRPTVPLGASGDIGARSLIKAGCTLALVRRPEGKVATRRQASALGWEKTHARK